MPKAYAELLRVRDLAREALPRHAGPRVHDRGRASSTSSRRATASGPGFAAVRIATDMVDEGLIDDERGRPRVEPEQLVQLLAPIFPIEGEGGRDQGRPAPRQGAARPDPGRPAAAIAFTRRSAPSRWPAKGEPVVLVRDETSPEDIAGMNAAVGILTTRGGMTSHAAVVARGMGKTCVVGAGDITVTTTRTARSVGARPQGVKEGDWISIDGTPGEVILGKLPTQPSEVLQVLIEGTLKPEESAVYRAFNADPEVGRRAPAPRRAGQRRHAERRPRRAPLRRRGDRPLPHRAHVLRGEAHRRGARDDPRRDGRGAPRRRSRRSSRCSARTSPGSSARWGSGRSRSASSIRRSTSSCPTTTTTIQRTAAELEGPGRRRSRAGPHALTEAEPDARPPRLPPRHHEPRDLRDAGPRDLRGRGRRRVAEGAKAAARRS